MQRDFRADLRRQLRFIENSCRLFDGGDLDEGIRIATQIRVMLNDTKRQESLLTHMGAKENVRLLSIAGAALAIDKGVITSNRIGIIRSGVGGSSFAPPTTDLPWTVPLSAKDWWEQEILRVSPGVTLTRALLILSAADKDGGAHVDPRNTEEYTALQQGGWGGMVFFENPDQSLENVHLSVLRVVGQEILDSPDIRALCEEPKAPPHTPPPAADSGHSPVR